MIGSVERMLRSVSKETLKKYSAENKSGYIDLRNTLIEEMDLTGIRLENVDLSGSNLIKVNLNCSNLQGLKAHNTMFKEVTFQNSKLCDASLYAADFRGCNLCGADLRGADVHAAMFYQANLQGIITDQNTKHFRMCCPEEGAFLAWKVCFNRRIVQLLVPEDARRVSGTTNEVRVDKAKVLTIKSVDYRESYEEAQSYVDENFMYRKGEMVYAENFVAERFIESGGGIHVWMTREEAIDYLG